jgi:4-hydroxy-3-methylbut-2-enyl diphosphate reductase
VYCLNEIVHNPIVVAKFVDQGVIFVSALTSVPKGSVVLLSAHGVAPEVRRDAVERGLNVVDATCPFVDKIHKEVRRWAAEGKRVFLVGHKQHEEIVGIAGEAPDAVVVIENEREARETNVPIDADVAVATQTTLSQDQSERVISILRSRYPSLTSPSRGDICYATLNRQKAVRALAGKAEIVLVIGSRNSSNTNRLVEVARAEGLRGELVDTIEVLEQIDFHEYGAVGVTAGASTPESFTLSVISALEGKGYASVEEMEVVEENCRLILPKI